MLTGTLSKTGSLSGILTKKETLSGSLSPSSPVSNNWYEGEYEITPLASQEVIIETKNKLMYDDVTVLTIPYLETSNEAGGVTVSIAS